MLAVSRNLYPLFQIRVFSLFLIFGIFCIFPSLNYVFAEENCYAKQIKLNTLKTLVSEMDSNRVNRISISDKQITEVIGDTEEFSYEIDGKGNVFISPLVLEGESFEITINLDNGKTQSLRFNVKNLGYGQTIILNDEELIFSAHSLQDRMIEIIKAVDSGLLDVVEKPLLKNQFIISAASNSHEIFRISKVKEVKVLGDIKSFVLEFTGEPDAFVDLKEKDLIWKKGKILAVTINKRSPDSNLEAIIIAQDGNKL